MSGKAHFNRLDSLLKHASVYKTEATAIFIEPVMINRLSHTDEITVIYNYGTDAAYHSATWSPNVSLPWLKWSTFSGWVNTADFISFLEENVLALLKAPNPQEEDDVAFLRLAGTFDLDWVSDEELFSTVRAPTDPSIKALFLVKLSPYVGGSTYRVPIRLFGKVNDNQRFWRIEMYAPQQTIDFAFDEAVTQISTALGIEPYYGSPEIKNDFRN